MSTALTELTIADAARLIAKRELSPVELARAYLDRIERFDRHVNAFLAVTNERALAQASACEAQIAAGRVHGPMHGIPYGLKDIYDVAGLATTGHSRAGSTTPAEADATCVAKLHHAGAVLLGKLATHEFADGGPGFDLPHPPARNPWNLDHITGGSSSGSGAAVAAGLLPMALGSDTGGSIRIPAGFCGVAGLKPTYGLISCHGVFPNSWTLDTCGPLARTVEDCAIVLGAIAGYDPADPASSDAPIPDYRAALSDDLRGMRIGVVRHFWEEDMLPNEESARAMEDAIALLTRLGARLQTVRMRPLRQYLDVRIIISESELLAVHQETFAQRPQDFGSDLLTRTSACVYQAVDYLRAQRERRRMIAEMEPLYRDFDVLLTAGSGSAPRLDMPHHGREWMEANSYIYTPFNVTGGPALALCAGYSAANLPIGMQIAGRPFDDATVLRVGHAYERAAGWSKRRPPLDGAVASLWPGQSPFPSDLPDAATRDYVDAQARRIGLQDEPRSRTGLHSAAGAALAMAQRLPRDHRPQDAPANIFRFPPTTR